MYFKDTSMMNMDELRLYVEALQREIVGQQEEIRTLRKPNKFFIGFEKEFISEQALIDWLPELSVKQITKFREIGTCFAVKINQERVDPFMVRSHAEAAAMLHRPG